MGGAGGFPLRAQRHEREAAVRLVRSHRLDRDAFVVLGDYMLEHELPVGDALASASVFSGGAPYEWQLMHHWWALVEHTSSVAGPKSSFTPRAAWASTANAMLAVRLHSAVGRQLVDQAWDIEFLVWMHVAHGARRYHTGLVSKWCHRWYDQTNVVRGVLYGETDGWREEWRMEALQPWRMQRWPLLKRFLNAHQLDGDGLEAIWVAEYGRRPKP